MIQIVSCILENDKGEILLYLRDNKPTIPFPHHWDLFGGYVEKGETLEQALIREVKEELDCNLTEYKFFKKYECLKGDVHQNIKYVYIGKVDKSIKELKLSEGEELKFFSREEIPNIKFANILKKIVVDYINSQ
jgi:8-oxo-dGTP diphosphatase